MKYIVVGAGIMGASTAYRLAKEGAEVTVVDRRDQGQATEAAAGIVCPWLSLRRNQAWYQLAKGGAAFYPSLIAELKEDGETETGYSKVGAISIHMEDEKLSAMEERAVKRREEAPEIGDITRLSSIEARTLFPPLAEGFGAVHISGAARVDGRALRDALLRAAQKHGAELLYSDVSLYFEGNTVKGVQSNGRLLKADQVIVCAGAWAQSLFRPLGIQFNVQYQKAQIIHLEYQNGDTARWPVVMPPNDQYLLAFENNRIIAGATHENIDKFDVTVTAGGLHEIFSKALAIAPGLAETRFLEARVGFRPFTPGFLPVFGELPGWKGILTANGLGASGLTMGPYLGTQLAKLALGYDCDIDWKKYDPAGAVE
ncbi:NAD(P)/FAD-dependent oxidoreductase [Peribacillus deserti]|uniref:FAD-dependent oxidoreductase n=1 Tax=Peribacillus deserti TaxID=673318 RepID=A0A2N5M832_9BACI|nr:FAD-binding oxidoreductase [Peribacillus deserti]PLT30492.1 FAD-dependent oxidoreductase [Peribacillus deserti]